MFSLDTLYCVIKNEFSDVNGETDTKGRNGAVPDGGDTNGTK
jgi:hypothetical protein